MDVGFAFPGQGAQFVGMGKDLYDESAAVRELFEIAGEAAGIDPAALIFDGTEEALKQTDNTQLAVTLINLAARALLLERGVVGTRAAGFSLGEYAAMVDAGVLTPTDAFTLVIARGRIMESVSREHDEGDRRSGMAAAMGKDIEEIRTILDQAAVDGAYPSLYNSPVQTVIGGTPSGLTAAGEALKTGGVRRIIPLKVSGPFHTPLMTQAREQFAEVACDVAFSDPVKPLYSNVSGGRVTSGEEARALCLDQLTHTVMWTTEERTLLSDGTDLILEVGPGSVLQGLWNAVAKVDEGWPTDRFLCAGTIEEIDRATEVVHG